MWLKPRSFQGLCPPARAWYLNPCHLGLKESCRHYLYQGFCSQTATFFDAVDVVARTNITNHTTKFINKHSFSLCTKLFFIQETFDTHMFHLLIIMLASVAAPRGGGRHGGIPKISHLQHSFGFCTPPTTFCPLNAPSQKKFWCRHWLASCRN